MPKMETSISCSMRSFWPVVLARLKHRFVSSVKSCRNQRTYDVIAGKGKKAPKLLSVCFDKLRRKTRPRTPGFTKFWFPCMGELLWGHRIRNLVFWVWNVKNRTKRTWPDAEQITLNIKFLSKKQVSSTYVGLTIFLIINQPGELIEQQHNREEFHQHLSIHKPQTFIFNIFMWPMDELR